MPTQPDFVPVDIPATQALALQFDTEGYQRADEDFARRFPNLVAGREFAISDALANLQGKDSKFATDALASAGLGDVNMGSNAFQKSKAFGATGQGLLDRQKRDRSYFQNLLAQNPQRQFGLTGQDIAHISLANTGGQNVYNQGAYGSRVAQYNQQVAQNAANTASYINSAGNLVGSLASAFNQPSGISQYYNPQTYVGYGTAGQPYGLSSSGYTYPILRATPAGGG